MSKNKESQLVVSNNEDVASASLIYLKVDSIAEYEKQLQTKNLNQ